MGDDVVQLRLSLNEETVKQVQNRIQNIVNKLNNRRVNITVNTGNLDNALKQLNTLQERINRINNTQIRVNSNSLLTTEQQQYRLETQRLAVLQRIQLAQERTNQTRNNAISALARQNRTLTQNLNVTQRIDGEVQHTHSHMRDTVEQTNSFVNLLQNGLTAFMGYKVINQVYESISDAYSELKNVDSEMVNIRKVTGKSADEMERLEKSSYKISQNYGRSPSEYLASTAAFAKAGYNDKSDKLGELALLTENVGDVDNDLANQFLISSDAAWKLNGDIEQLSTILDGFNELSNRTATTVNDLAEGMTVSASVFAQAGLSAKDYSALVGTAQAKTQESGKVVARGMRTILMNIRQIKGTDLETGEIIDENSLAKAESTLEDVGIDIRETVNGVSELRNPMQILQDLADKWENLSSVQQSAIQEALANKRQSNIFTALMENFNDVKKASQIYDESAGSAMRENEYYLDSWNAKLEMLKANWTSYISSITDISAIKTSLDVVSGILKLLNTGVGQFATQMTLLVVSLNLANRALQAFAANNVYAGIIQLGLAEGNLGMAIRMVTGDLIEQAAAWAATPVGMITILIAAVYGITKAYDLFTVSLDEHRQKLDDLKSKYDEFESKLQSIQSELETATQRIVELEAKDNLTFVEREELDKLKETNAELKRQQDLLEQSKKLAQNDVNKEFVATMKKDVDDTGEYTHYHTPFLGADNGTWKTWSWSSIWRDLGSMGMGVDYSTSERSYIEQQFQQYESLKDQYANATTQKDKDRIDKQIKEIETYLNDKSQQWLTDSDGIGYITNPQNDDERKVNEYLDYINDFRDRVAIETGGTDAKYNAFTRILNKDEFSDIKSQLESLGDVGELTGEKIKDLIPVGSELYNKLVSLGVIAEDDSSWYGNLANTFNKVTEAADTNSIALKELNDSLDKIQSTYQVASTAIEEYNENGYISVDTFQSLMELEPEYLNLLMDENGTLALTSENLYKLTEARINDLAAKQASTLVDSVTKLGSEAEQLQYLTQATDGATESTWGLVYAKIAEAQAAGTISDDVAGRLKSQVEAYQTWANAAIDGINKGSLGKSSNSSKSEKDKAKALKDYEDKVKDINEKLEELDKAEHLSNLKYSIETITQDLNKFEQSLDRLSSKLDLTFEKDYSAKLSIIGQQFLGASRYGGEMRVELERLLAIEPQTADEAEELASRLKSLSDSFFENEKNIIEYRNSLFETATDYLGESASATVEQVNNAKSILDNTFNVIKNGSLSGDGFWSATLLPSISKDKVTKQRAENNKLIKEEKRYQNAIAKIRKKATDMSYAEEKEEREKQRQEYQEELQEAYEDYQDKINDVIGQNIEVTDSVKSIGDEYLNTADKAENAAQRMSDAMNNINWEQRSYANKSYTYEDGAPTSAQYQYAYGDSKSTVVVTKKAKGGTTSQGLTITGDGTGAYAGQEAYIGQDGKLHLFNNEAQLSELPPNTRIVNAKDLQNIIKYTGMKYFYQPIENIQSATVDKFAQGNTNVSFSPIPYNTLSTQALYSDINVQAMVEETIAEINNEFNALKGNIKFTAVQTAFKNSLTDKKMYKDLSNIIVNMTSQSLDKADKSTLSDSVVGLILQNSAWDDLPNELQNKLSELNVNADNWTDWIKDSNNSLQAFNLMQDGGMSSWDLLDSNVTSLLQQAGINGKDAWDKFVQDDPLQALTLLSSSWNSMNDTIGQYMTDAQTIAANGARAIQSLQIIAPSISEQSWNALQVLIANKIQEIISLMNEVFGENTVDMNFAINVNNGALSGNSQTNPQGDNEIINTAKSFLGTPYVWGGTSPSGFDCSGFTQYVLAQNGKSIPRTSQEQFASGQAVDKSNLQAGDLVFYGNGEATHVGIYEGNNKIIHSPHTGDVVKESDFSTYWTSAYLGARRYYKGTEGALPGLAKLGDEAEVKGLNYPTPEILIRQKTGKAYLTGLDGTQIVNLDRGDTVIPYADTKRILNGNVLHAYANGTPNAKDAISRILGINNVKNRVNNGSTRSNNSGITNNTVQQSWDANDFGQGVGKSHSYTAFDENGYLGSSLGYWDTSSSAWKLFKKLLDSGDLSTDENGIYTYKDARLVAMTSTFGKPGDVMRYTQDDGSVFYGIIMDEKSQAYTWYDNNPANKWGHNNGQDMVEFEVKKSAIAPAYKANGGTPPYGNLNHAITLIENLGSLEGFDFSDMPSVGGTSVLTQKMQEFMSKLQQVYGTFKTNTHTSATKVGNVKSLGDKKQSSYSFDVPFTQKEKGGIVPAGTIAQVNEHNAEATIDKKGNLVPLGDGTPQVFVSDKPFPVINAADYAKIKKYGGDKKPVQFLKNGNTSVSVNADNTDEEKEQTAEERKAEENTSKINQTLKNIEGKLDSGVLSDDIKKLDLPTLEALDKLTDSWGDDDTITSDILMQFKDYAKDFFDYEKWAEDDLSNILNSYSEDFYEKYYAEKDKYDSWQSDFKERFKKWVEHPTDGNYMSDYFKFADEASKKATESLITQQTLVADNMKDALDELKDKSEVLKKLIQDAPTAELAQKARDELKDINENIDEIESNYADTMEQITERKLQDISNRDSKYTRETGMLQYDRNILQDQYNRSTDDEEKAKLAKEITESMKKERDIEQERVDAAHKANQEIYENATGQRKTVLENVKMSELYNADGSFNDAAYNETVELLEGIGGSDLVQVFKQLASEMQKNSQVYLEGTENIRNLNNEIQDQEQEEANQKIELETSRYEKLNKILDVRLNKEKAITSALQEQYSFQQSLRDAALDYQSELIANKNRSQWLDDDTRALLFNENDYSDMMNTINGLNNEMARAYKKYKSDISTLGEEDYYQEQQITNAYNRRIEQLKEQLEVAKQNLEVTKKNAEFQNTLKERDTRILVGDRWVNVADPEKLYNTQLEATKAQMSLDNIMQDNAENQNVRDMEAQSDITQKMISANDKYIEVLNGLSDDEKKRHAETLESTEALIASNIMLGGSNIGWANEYSTSDESFNGQVAGLNNVEIGRQFYYNKDYDLNQSSLDDLLKDGVISEEIHKVFSKINETHRNNKLTADPVNSKYAPQTFEHDGLESTSPMGANGDAKVQMKQAEQTEQITDYAAELEKYYELAKKQNGYLSAEDRAKAQRLEIARNIKVANSPLNYEQTSDFGAQIFANDFSQDYSDIENFCKENGGLTEQEAIFFDSWHASHEEYIALADMLLSTGQDNTKLLSALNEQLGIKLSEMITNKIEEYNANLPSVGSIATAHYATGTKSAKGGLAITDEDGYEAKLRKLSVGRYSMLNAGDMVFDKEATDVLWEFAKNPQNFIDQVSIFKQSPQQMPATNTTRTSTEINQFNGDIVLTEHIQNGNEFVRSLTDKINEQYSITKNMKI
ncbi:MAG: NlpC/P60 family protein [Hominilimicola sp.]|uniref:NlpC/P60 family protein n=1 Tax=Hominilimicola sp. TaxID=3073571 RepID=UPI00399B4C69